MEVRAIDFVVLSVSDVKKAKRFYQDVLGIGDRILSSMEGWVEFDTHPVALALGEPPVEFSKVPETVIALAVDDVHAAIAELRAQGVTIVFEPVETSVCTMACIEDPDGNRLFVHQRHDGTSG